MATTSDMSRLTLFDHHEVHEPAGAWWPRSRVLADELAALLDLWPASAGYIARVLYSPPDWDDRPRSVQVPGRRIKTGCFPGDDTEVLVLTMGDRTRRSITVIAPAASSERAAALLRR